jgi:hypothetical protein
MPALLFLRLNLFIDVPGVNRVNFVDGVSEIIVSPARTATSIRAFGFGAAIAGCSRESIWLCTPGGFAPGAASGLLEGLRAELV